MNEEQCFRIFAIRLIFYHFDVILFMIIELYAITKFATIFL